MGAPGLQCGAGNQTGHFILCQPAHLR